MGNIRSREEIQKELHNSYEVGSNDYFDTKFVQGYRQALIDILEEDEVLFFTNLSK